MHAELVGLAGSKRAARIEARLLEAARAFAAERYGEARPLLEKLAKDVPGSPSVRELLGLTYYRLGRWRDAVRELEAFRALTGSIEQHPVLADSMRALGRHREVADLWDELRQASPSPELIAEGRIVAAGALADRGELSDAIRTLSAGRWRVKSPREHHLRMAYALADLHERSGDVPRARELFGWIHHHAPDFADVRERLRSLA